MAKIKYYHHFLKLHDLDFQTFETQLFNYLDQSFLVSHSALKDACSTLTKTNLLHQLKVNYALTGNNEIDNKTLNTQYKYLITLAFNEALLNGDFTLEVDTLNINKLPPFFLDTALNYLINFMAVSKQIKVDDTSLPSLINKEMYSKYPYYTQPQQIKQPIIQDQDLNEDDVDEALDYIDTEREEFLEQMTKHLSKI